MCNSHYSQESTDGSYIETKDSALVWNYRDADPDFGSWQVAASPDMSIEGLGMLQRGVMGGARMYLLSEPCCLPTLISTPRMYLLSVIHLYPPSSICTPLPHPFPA
jgi:hypothetical protein